MIDKSKLQSALNRAVPGEWAHVIRTSSLVDDNHRVVLNHEKETATIHVSIEDANTDKTLAGTSTSSKALRKDTSCVEIVAEILTEQVNSL